jgi:hypothetical protein
MRLRACMLNTCRNLIWIGLLEIPTSIDNEPMFRFPRYSHQTIFEVREVTHIKIVGDFSSGC